MSAPIDTHPAPARRHIDTRALWFGLFGAPVAWSIQTLVNLPLAAHACFPRLEPLPSPTFSGVRAVVVGVSVAALAVAICATIVAWRAWSSSRGEQQESSGGGREHREHIALVETGEGRTRFMALAGVMASGTFLLVSAAHLATLLFVSPCGV